jgi:LPS-assembly protein
MPSDDRAGPRPGAHRAATARYCGPELQLQVQRFEGFFLQPEFQFPLLGGWPGARIDFLDSERARHRRPTPAARAKARASRTGCCAPTASSIDFEAQRRHRRRCGAALLGVPILALPVLSFPLSDAASRAGCRRRSHWTTAAASSWACPTTGTSRPTAMPRSRRRCSPAGAWRQREFRYLEPRYRGRLAAAPAAATTASPIARATPGSSSTKAAAAGRATTPRCCASPTTLLEGFPALDCQPHARLLEPAAAARTGRGDPGGTRAGLRTGAALAGAAARDTSATIVAPYQRSAAAGRALAPAHAWWPAGHAGNRVQPLHRPTDAGRPAHRATGWRWHALGRGEPALARPGWWFTPRLSSMRPAMRSTSRWPTAAAAHA